MPIGFQSVSPTVVPQQQQLFDRIFGSIPSPQSFESILQQGIDSPLLRQVLEPALQALIPRETEARQNLTDQFRSAGALRSGAYGAAVPRLEGEIGRSRGNLISQVISQILQSIIGGSLQAQRNAFLPTESLTNLFGANRPQPEFGGSDSSGRAGGFGGGGLSNPADRARHQEMFRGGQPNFINPQGSRLLGGAPSGGGYPPGASFDDIVSKQYSDFIKNLGIEPYDSLLDQPFLEGRAAGVAPYYDPSSQAYTNLGLAEGSGRNDDPYAQFYTNLEDDIDGY